VNAELEQYKSLFIVKMDISWSIGSLNEPIARQANREASREANREDKCTGNF
jgi:hypothetical protein